MAPAERYEVLGLLGTGGMGEVYLARPAGAPDQRVALKRLRGDRAGSTASLAQFEREARIGMLLRHPNIASVLELGSDEAGPYLVMEYVDGCSLERLLGDATSPPFGDAELALIAVAVARALAAAHGFRGTDGRIHGVLHRDVSADNVLIARSGEVKLTDFGVARLVGATALTQAGELKGKLSHLAPEVFEGAEPATTADVWALGVTLYRAACGVDPFPGATQAQVIHAVLHGRPAPLVGLRPQLAPAFSRCVEACLARAPASRPTAEAVAQQLLPLCAPDARSSLARRVGQTASSAAAIEPGRARTQTVVRGRPRARWITPSAVLALIALVGGGYSALRTREDRREGSTPQPKPDSAETPSPAGNVVPPAPGSPDSRTLSGPIVSATEPAAEVPSAPRPPSPGPPSKPHGAERAAGSSHPTGGARPSTGSGGTAVTPRRASNDSTPAPGAARTEPGASAEVNGLLAIKVRPWGRVFIDGRLVGTTPLAPLELAPGKHSVVVVNEELGQRHQSEVEVSAGQTETLRLFLDQP